MLNKIILASKSKIRREILDKNNIPNDVKPSNVDEDIVKESLIKENATPEIISKNLAELKANKVSQKFVNHIVLGADSVIDLDGEIISKPENRNEALVKATYHSALVNNLQPNTTYAYRVGNGDKNDDYWNAARCIGDICNAPERRK